MPGFTVAEFVQQVALTSIATQRRLDAQYGDDLKAALDSAAPLIPLLGPQALHALAPSRMLVRRMSVRTAIIVERNRATKFQLTVQPLGLGFAALFETKTSSSSQITIGVQQIPLHATVEEAHFGQ
jgi:hypothetical protein